MAVELMDLPQEIIELILSYLTQINDLLRVAQVCCKFYQISRRQLKPNGKLIIDCTETLPETDTCPMIECFQNVEIFPFSSLYIPDWSDTYFDRGSAFWTQFGGQIHTVTTDCFRNDIPDLVRDLNRYFPNLRSLTVKNPQYDPNSFARDSPTVWNLSIDELSFDSTNADVQEVMYLLRCSPRLRSLFLSVDCDWSIFTPHLLPYFEAIEAVEINTENHILTNLSSLPSKIILSSVVITDFDPIGKLRQFFSTKRTIKKLYFALQPTLEQIMTISSAVSVEVVILDRGLPKFAGSLDVVAEMPDVKKISLSAGQEQLEIDTLYPFYWSNQKSLTKITEFWIGPVRSRYLFRYLRHYADFSHITRIEFSVQFGHQITLLDSGMQLILQLFPKLESFKIDETELTDAGILGYGSEDEKSISCLENLEHLDFGKSLGITTASFEAFKFPKLEIFKISNPRISNVALTLLAQNAPNLKEIELTKSALDEKGLEFAVKKLPNLRKITFNGTNMTDAVISSIKKRFSYVKIILESDLESYLESDQE